MRIECLNTITGLIEYRHFLFALERQPLKVYFAAGFDFNLFERHRE